MPNYKPTIEILETQLTLAKFEVDNALFCVKSATSKERREMFKKKLNRKRAIYRSIQYSIGLLNAAKYKV
nr:hypothetical protein [uncultured Flavobacterium sp.]